ncbi:hypothetical protein BZA70DRAFT_127018 [Myxozyma melibiosi]|uniref:Uncharacterized protein n=1 Tax=Myxozyma melibiosi TaxID=54550 RepID=A0ABR1F8Q2_9ASCO
MLLAVTNSYLTKKYKKKKCHLNVVFFCSVICLYSVSNIQQGDQLSLLGKERITTVSNPLDFGMATSSACWGRKVTVPDTATRSACWGRMIRGINGGGKGMRRREGDGTERRGWIVMSCILTMSIIPSGGGKGVGLFMS